MARKNKGPVFLLIGCVLLLIAIFWYIYNIAEDNRAGVLAEELLKELDHHQNSTAEREEPVIIVEGDAFCGKIIIEKLKVELPVYDEWNDVHLKSAPCRYAGSLDTNDMVIAAHNYKSHFGSLDQLIAGDKLQFVDAYGKTHLYEVQDMITIDGSAVSDMRSGGWDFTLFTCTKSGEQRVTVRCRRI